MWETNEWIENSSGISVSSGKRMEAQNCFPPSPTHLLEPLPWYCCFAQLAFVFCSFTILLYIKYRDIDFPLFKCLHFV